MTTVDLPLLPLGPVAPTRSPGRGVEVPGDLPAASDPDLVARAHAKRLGDRLFVLGHHYQRDEVIEFADVTGDSPSWPVTPPPGGLEVHRLLRRYFARPVRRHPHRPGPEGIVAGPAPPRLLR